MISFPFLRVQRMSGYDLCIRCNIQREEIPYAEYFAFVSQRLQSIERNVRSVIVDVSESSDIGIDRG